MWMSYRTGTTPRDSQLGNRQEAILCFRPARACPRIFLLEYFELIHLGLGAEEMTPFAVVAKPRGMPGPRGSVLAGLAFALALSTSSAAMAECTGTGQLSSITSFLPFSAGGAVSSLVSAINTTNTAFL